MPEAVGVEQVVPGSSRGGASCTRNYCVSVSMCTRKWGGKVYQEVIRGVTTCTTAEQEIVYLCVYTASTSNNLLYCNSILPWQNGAQYSLPPTDRG